MTLELDHLFVFVEATDIAPGGPTRSRLDAAGLVPSYERRHAGQGTANLCYVFDNAYLEFLYATDPSELAGPAVARTGLSARSRWRATGASPFGIGLRGTLPFKTWPYRFDGLPPGLAVPVAIDSADIRQPFLFGSPGTAPPSRWTDGRAGERQTATGLAEITGIHLELAAAPKPALLALAARGIVELSEGGNGCAAATLSIFRGAHGIARLRLPEIAWS